MRAEIRITITDGVTMNNLPAEAFSKSRTMVLDLPIRGTKFISAVESLLTDHLVQSVSPLVTTLESDVNAFIETIKQSGKQQLMLPLEPPPEDAVHAE